MADKYKLGDVFIGTFPITQAFGARPEVYSARYNMKGHNGLDFGTPSTTPVLAAYDGKVSEVGFDANGYGKYIKIVHDGYLTLYGHLNDQIVNIGDPVVCGQLIGHSNNTGFSDAPHLHFGVAPCDVNGGKTEYNNGYVGYIDPSGDRCEWDLKNLTVSNVATPVANPPVSVPSRDFVNVVTKSTNFDVVAAYFKLTEAEKLDPKEGEKLVEQLSLKDQLIADLQGKLSALTPVPSDPTAVVPVTDERTTNFLLSLVTMIKDFIFEPKK